MLLATALLAAMLLATALLAAALLAATILAAAVLAATVLAAAFGRAVQWCTMVYASTRVYSIVVYNRRRDCRVATVVRM